jgi:hypothetical protein
LETSIILIEPRDAMTINFTFIFTSFLPGFEPSVIGGIKKTAHHLGKTSGKEGLKMNIFTDKGIYEVVYKGRHFSFLSFIRKDCICDVCYITLKNILTGEMFTFDKSGILGIREMSGALEASAG